MEGYRGHRTYLIRFDLTHGRVNTGSWIRRSGRLTQQKNLDWLVFSSISLFVDLLVYSVRPLLCLLLRPESVLLVMLGFVRGRSKDVSERVVVGGPGSGEHSSTTTGRAEGRWLKGKKKSRRWKGERELTGNGNGGLRPNKHSEVGDANRRERGSLSLAPSLDGGWLDNQTSGGSPINPQ